MALCGAVRPPLKMFFSLLPQTISQGIKNDRFAPAWKN
jgi:hypothetical protein